MLRVFEEELYAGVGFTFLLQDRVRPFWNTVGTNG